MNPMSKQVTMVVLLAIGATGCNVNRALEQVHEARQLSADLSVQFTKAADASNLAVMSDTDVASTTFVKEAENRSAAVQNDIDRLQPVLDRLGYTEESRLLGEFRSRFDDYRRLDRTILDLAFENSNFKAQALASGTGREAADAVSTALGGLEPPSNPSEDCHVKALAANVDARVREIEALQAHHIVTPDDETMTSLEKRMSASEASARDSLKRLSAAVRPPFQARVTAAGGALDRLVATNRQIIELSRRNTNLRSVALSLTEKRPVVAACEERLHALEAALAKRGFVSHR
jgi:hypothetical protein